MIRAIERDELRGMMDAGENFVLVCALEPEEFDRERICGSIGIPAADIEKNALNLINKYETVVVYGSGEGGGMDRDAADKLESLGYNDIWMYEGGLKEWRESGYCVEGSLHREKAA